MAMLIKVFHAGLVAPRLDNGASDQRAVERDEGQKRVEVEIGVACNSSSMGFAFLHSGMKVPECIMLRQRSAAEDRQNCYETFCCFGSHHHWETLA